MAELWGQFIHTLTANYSPIIWGFVDWLLVLLLIWRFFLMLRGTRAVTFLYIVAALFVLQVVVRQLPVPFFNALMQIITPMLLVAVPVIFQPELRRSFEKLGRRSFFSRLFGSHPGETRFVNMIVQAAASMAESRVGGLIVIERELDLAEIAATGVLLDAVPTAELIQQIFAVSGPLHDGALIIKGQRVLAAACVLPLSADSGLGTGIGTRHRAGLGLAETTDAVVVVVSEQRGSLSLAVDARLEMALTPEQLAQRLTNLMQLDTAEYEPKKYPRRSARRQALKR